MQEARQTAAVRHVIFGVAYCIECLAVVLIYFKKRAIENRAAYYEKGERRKRAHRLITRGAAIESVAPQTKDLSETAFYAFTEQVFALPDTQRLLKETGGNHAGGD